MRTAGNAGTRVKVMRASRLVALPAVGGMAHPPGEHPPAAALTSRLLFGLRLREACVWWAGLSTAELSSALVTARSHVVTAGG